MDTVAITLATQQREVLKDLTTLSVAEVLDLLDMDGMPLNQAIQVAPTIVEPYLNLASVSGANYYNDVRFLAQETAQEAYTAYTARSLSEPSVTTRNKVYGGLGALSKEAEDAVTALAISTAIEKGIFTSWRETVNWNTRQDSTDSYVNIITAPNACAWCRWLKAEDFISLNKTESRLIARGRTQGTLDSGGSTNFHDNCRCTYGVVFKGEDWQKYQTPEDKVFREILSGVRADGASGQDAVLSALRAAGYK